MSSKQVTDRLKSTEYVASAGTVYAERIADAIAEEIGREHREPVRKLVLALAQKAQERTQAAVAADDAHEAELADDAGQRAERDQAVSQLRGVVVQQREQVTALLGAQRAAELGFSGITPDDPVALQRTATTILERYAKARPQPTSLPGYTFEPKQFAEPIKAPLAALETALAAVGREVREAQATQEAKNRALAASDKTFSLTANLLSALLAAAGEQTLARKVRPSGRDPGTAAQPEAPVTAVGAPEGAPDTPEAAVA